MASASTIPPSSLMALGQLPPGHLPPGFLSSPPPRLQLTIATPGADPAGAPSPLQPAGTEEAELRDVQLAIAGDEAAFRRIVDRHGPALLVFARRLVRDHAEAQDLVQESFAKAFVALPRFDPKYRLSTWLHRIALNNCRDFLKSARRRERVTRGSQLPERLHNGPGPEQQLQQRRSAERLQRGMAELSPTYRQALELKDLQGLSYSAMSLSLQTPVTALKIRVLRARARLREVLRRDAYSQGLDC